ncbi:MAG: hypothetical protein Q8K02_10485 [Flavobacterium sp.]|nr:hypothetical protein [Flavobacterium sp.]
MTKSLAITQPYLDDARGSKTPLLKPVFTRSSGKIKNRHVSYKTQLFLYGRGITANVSPLFTYQINYYFSQKETGNLKPFVSLRPIRCKRSVSSLELANTTWNHEFLDPLKAIAQQDIYVS